MFLHHSGHCGPAAATAAATAAAAASGAAHGTSDIKFYDDQQLGSTHSGTSADPLHSAARRESHQLHMSGWCV